MGFTRGLLKGAEETWGNLWVLGYCDEEAGGREAGERVQLHTPAVQKVKLRNNPGARRGYVRPGRGARQLSNQIT